MQNLLILNVPRERADALVAEAEAGRLPAHRLAVLAGRRRLHRHRVLQAGAYRDQGFRALAGGGTRGPAAGLRPAPEAPRHRLPQQLRPALDRRHRHRGQEDQGGRPAGGRLLLLRRRRRRRAPGEGAAHRLPLPRHRGAGRDRAPAPRLPRRAPPRRELPTDDGAVNAAVAREGYRRGVWVNAADDPAHCAFILPSVLRRDLQVAVATGGRAPRSPAPSGRSWKATSPTTTRR